MPTKVCRLLKKAITDEQQAAPFYANMVSQLRKYGLSAEAYRVERIMKQERGHKSNLTKIARENGCV